MVLPKAEEEWGERAAAFLKAEMKKAGVTYAELSKRLKKHGLKETEAGITVKLKRRTFSATFFNLPCGDGIGRGGVGGDLGPGIFSPHETFVDASARTPSWRLRSPPFRRTMRHPRSFRQKRDRHGEASGTTPPTAIFSVGTKSRL